jgi:hypothetical protein
MIKGVLMGIVIGIAGCNSHDSKQITNSDKPAASRAAANTARGNVGLAPVVNIGAVNQVADQAKSAINTAATSANTAANEVNRTAATVQSDVQQATYDAATVTNDAAKDGNNLLNNATRDVNKLKKVLR